MVGCLSDHHVVLCKVRLVGAWIKRREVVNEERKIRSKKLREHQYMERYTRFLESKRVEWDEGRNVELMWGKLWVTVLERCWEKEPKECMVE